MKTQELLGTTLKYYQDQMVKSVNNAMYSDFFVKPSKYFIKPIFTFKIPQPYIDFDYESDRKGLFIHWHRINIGKRKVLNPDYKEEMKKWNKRPKTIKFI